MKGTITRCLVDMLEARGGRAMWERVAAAAGVSAEDPVVKLAGSDVDDEVAVRLFTAASRETGLGWQPLCDAYGEYWCCTYVPKLYPTVVAPFRTAREMLLAMDRVHVDLTKRMPNARPPRFTYAWKNDRTVLVTYTSSRNLIDLFVGLARGLGKRFNEEVKVTRLSESTAEVTFAR